MPDEKIPVNADAKFGIGELLYNRNTKEDGRVTRVYEFEGAVMYEVAVRAIPTWGDRYVSDWSESALELSKVAALADPCEKGPCVQAETHGVLDSAGLRDLWESSPNTEDDKTCQMLGANPASWEACGRPATVKWINPVGETKYWCARCDRKWHPTDAQKAQDERDGVVERMNDSDVESVIRHARALERIEALTRIEDAIRERMKTVKNEAEKKELDSLIKRSFNPECAFDRKYRNQLATLAIAPDELGWFWKLRERIHRVVHHH